MNYAMETLDFQTVSSCIIPDEVGMPPESATANGLYTPRIGGTRSQPRAENRKSRIGISVFGFSVHVSLVCLVGRLKIVLRFGKIENQEPGFPFSIFPKHMLFVSML